ncbi:MAG TPA: fatty acid desaturase [Anaerolineales bacterium]|nr:fatty acid desaturase [Anaerolineales bacterium]HLO30307.1 fatty acid desaturase [Anaerolineales bacterium]
MNRMTNLEGNVHWQQIVAAYARPDLRKSLWQIINTLIPFFALFYFSIRSVEISIWLTLPLTLLTAGFMIRAFIIFHDCGHGSFFKSQRANDIVGFVTGLLAFTPYYRWKHEHAIHHATSGDLDRRGTGDVYTMTVQEYLQAPWWKRFGYRVLRNPFAMLLIGPLLVFVIVERIPPPKGKREIASVWWTNLTLALIVTVMILVFGWRNYLITQLLVLFFGTSAGVWLFYVQHNYEGVYWERHSRWNYFDASLQGSSFYKLPAVLQWFTGNIGFHHIHHLGSKIPNYNLPKAYRENTLFHVKPLTLISSLKCLKWRLYDETNRRLAGWEVLKQYRQGSVTA